MSPIEFNNDGAYVSALNTNDLKRKGQILTMINACKNVFPQKISQPSVFTSHHELVKYHQLIHAKVTAITDEIYRKLSSRLSPKVKANTMTVHEASKAYTNVNKRVSFKVSCEQNKLKRKKRKKL